MTRERPLRDAENVTPDIRVYSWRPGTRARVDTIRVVIPAPNDARPAGRARRTYARFREGNLGVTGAIVILAGVLVTAVIVAGVLVLLHALGLLG